MVLGTSTGSSAIDFSGVSLPFDVGDLLSSATGLMGVFSGFILLGLAIVFTPKLFGLIRNAASTKGKN